MKNYVDPLIGSTPVRHVDTTGVMSVLTPIWHDKPETASRVRGRIEMIPRAAKAEGLRTGDNPAAWRERIKPLLPSKRKVRAVVHHPALPCPALPAAPEVHDVAVRGAIRLSVATAIHHPYRRSL
jgi:hypothetical protein